MHCCGSSNRWINRNFLESWEFEGKVGVSKTAFKRIFYNFHFHSQTKRDSSVQCDLQWKATDDLAPNYGGRLQTWRRISLWSRIVVSQCELNEKLHQQLDSHHFVHVDSGLLHRLFDGRFSAKTFVSSRRGLFLLEGGAYLLEFWRIPSQAKKVGGASSQFNQKIKKVGGALIKLNKKHPKAELKRFFLNFQLGSRSKTDQCGIGSADILCSE